MSKMKNRFFGKFHPDVISQKKDSRRVETDFIKDLDVYTQVFSNESNRLVRKEFDLFMSMWEFELGDQGRFMEIVVECFRLSEIAGMVSEIRRQKAESGINLKKNRAHQPIDGRGGYNGVYGSNIHNRGSGSGVRGRNSSRYNGSEISMPRSSNRSRKSGRSGRRSRKSSRESGSRNESEISEQP